MCGDTYALLTRMSSFPEVMRLVVSLHAAILAGFVTSSWRVHMPISARSRIKGRFRAVAMTKQALRWNSTARAWPIPPGEQLENMSVSMKLRAAAT